MSPVTLQDWFGSVEAQADAERGFGVVVWGRRVEAERDSERGSDAKKATLSAYRMDQRLSDTSFVDREGTPVKLLGPSDEGRATLAGVPLAFIDSFRQGIPPAFQMMVGLAPTLLARASSEPISPRIPPGESPPPSPALAPSLSSSAAHAEHLTVDSDDELLPPSLFDMQTGYVRSEGAVSTRKELYRALVEAKGRPVAEIEADSEPLLFTKDRDEGYDEDAEDAEDDGVPDEDSETEGDARSAHTGPTESASQAVNGRDVHTATAVATPSATLPSPPGSPFAPSQHPLGSIPNPTTNTDDLLPSPFAHSPSASAAFAPAGDDEARPAKSASTSPKRLQDSKREITLLHERDEGENEPGHVEAEAGKEIVLERADAGRAFTPPSSDQAIYLPQTPSALATTRPSTPLTRPPTPSTLFHLSPFNNVSHSSLASIADLYQDSEADSNDGDFASFVDQDTEGLGSESVLRPIGEHPPIEDDVPAEEEPRIVEEPEVEGLSSTVELPDTVPATPSAPPSLPPSPSPSDSLPLLAPFDPSLEHLDAEAAPGSPPAPVDDVRQEEALPPTTEPELKTPLSPIKILCEPKFSVPAVEDDARSVEVDERLSAVVPEPSSSEHTEPVELAAESPPSPAVVAPPPPEAATKEPQPSLLLEPEPVEIEGPAAEAAVPDPARNVDAADDEPFAEPPSKSGREGANSHQHSASELEVMEVEPEDGAVGIEGKMADSEASLSVDNPTLEEQLEEAAQFEPPRLPLPAEPELFPPESVEPQLDEGEQEDGVGAADGEPLATNSLGSFDDSLNDFGGGGDDFGEGGEDLGGGGEGYIGGEESPGELGAGASWELVEQDADEERIEQSVILPRPSADLPPPSPGADPATAARSSQEAPVAPPPPRNSSSSQPRDKARFFFVEVPVSRSLKRSRNNSPTRSEHSTSTDELSLLPVDSPVAAAPAVEVSRKVCSSGSLGKRRTVVSVEIPARRDVVASTSTLAPPAPPSDAGANDSEDDLPLAPRRRSSIKKKSRAPVLPPSPSASDMDERLQAAPSPSSEPSNATSSRNAPCIRSKSKAKGKGKARLPPSPSPQPSPTLDDPQPPPNSASLSVQSLHAPPSPPVISHSRPKPQKRAASSTAPTGPRRKLLKKGPPTTASTPAIASASFANRKGSLSRSKRGQTESPAPAPTPTSTRPTRERKSAAGWWEIPNALNALRKSKLKRPREVVQPEEGDDEEDDPDPPIAEDEDEDDGKEDADEAEEEMVVVRPAKRSRREDQQQTDGSGSQPSASVGTKKAVTKVKVHRSKPTPLLESGKVPARFRGGDQWEGMTEVVAREDPFGFSD